VLGTVKLNIDNIIEEISACGKRWKDMYYKITV
jgi:hypothetical protein